MAVGGEDRVVGAEIFVDCLGLGGDSTTTTGMNIPIQLSQRPAGGQDGRGASHVGQRPGGLSTGCARCRGLPADVSGGSALPVTQAIRRQLAAGAGDVSRAATEARRAGARSGLRAPASEVPAQPVRRARQVADQLVLGQRAGPEPGRIMAMQRRDVRQRPLRRHRAGQRRQAQSRGSGVARGRRARGPRARPSALRTSVAPSRISMLQPAARASNGMARHRHHLAPLIERGARGDQAAGSRRRLDHDHRPRQARDDAVAQREMAGLRLQPHGLFARSGSPRPRSRAARAAFSVGVDHVDPARLHRDRVPVGQRRLMRRGVDAAREARDDDMNPASPSPSASRRAIRSAKATRRCARRPSPPSGGSAARCRPAPTGRAGHRADPSAPAG